MDELLVYCSKRRLRLRLETNHLELTPRELLREIERYRSYAAGP